MGEQPHPNSTQPIHFSQAPATSMEIPSLHGSMFATVSRPTELNLATHSNTQQGWFMMNMLEYAFKVLPGDEGFHQGCPNSWMVHYMERPKIKWMISLGLPPFEETYIYIYTYYLYIYIYTYYIYTYIIIYIYIYTSSRAKNLADLLACSPAIRDSGAWPGSGVMIWGEDWQM